MKNLTKKTWGYLVLLCALLGLFFMFIVTIVESYLPAQPLPSTIPIAPAAEPNWLFIYYPKPGQAISLKDYKNNSNKSICMEIEFYWLVRKKTWTNADRQRISIFVDGIQRDTESPIKSWNRAWNNIWDTMTGQPIRNGGWGPYDFCVYAPVTPGVHKVDAVFNSYSGATPTFSWTFEIFKDAIPTPTLLPAPAVIDHQKHLPPFLRAVYPNPGQIVSLGKYVDIESDDEKVWVWKERPNEHIAEMQGSICLAFKRNELDKLGSLPSRVVDWPSRIYLHVDGTILNDWIYPYRSYPVGLDDLQVHCPSVSLGIGKHIVSLYIDPYNTDLTSYSWEFTIEK